MGRGDHGKLAAGDLAADGSHGDILAAEENSGEGFDFYVGHCGALGCGEAANLGLGEADVVHVAGGDSGYCGVDCRKGQAEGGRVVVYRGAGARGLFRQMFGDEPYAADDGGGAVYGGVRVGAYVKIATHQWLEPAGGKRWLHRQRGRRRSRGWTGCKCDGVGFWPAPGGLHVPRTPLWDIFGQVKSEERALGGVARCPLKGMSGGTEEVLVAKASDELRDAGQVFVFVGSVEEDDGDGVA